jgi:hypothetical protein
MIRMLLAVLACSLASGGSPIASTQSQKPDGGWGVTRLQPHQVSRVYWELQQQMDVLVRLAPLGSDGKPARLVLVFQAFFPGRAQRDPYSGLPQWPKAPPARVTVTAQAYPLTFVIPSFTLTLIADDQALDLTGPGGRFQLIPCASEGCSPTGVEAGIDPAALRALVAATSIKGEALGTPIALTEADRRALSEFAQRVNLQADAAAGVR